MLVTTRVDDDATAAEVAAILRYADLTPESIRHVRGEREGLPPELLDGMDALILTGSPFTASDPAESKSADQLRVEEELRRMLDRVLAEDLPLLGACYGVSTLGLHQGAVVDRTYGEPSGATTIELTDAGRADPVFRALPDRFDAFVGHKEAIRVLPPGAVLLATGAACPVQAFRIGQHQYATQFHPELDVEGLVARVTLYRDAGYFPSHELDRIIDAARRARVGSAHAMLRSFADRYLR
ncbi:MAG: glutamine amidotransferase [Micrococcales bacterium]|nr:glutamine amidotransferase [Micrococcales bacterium]